MEVDNAKEIERYNLFCDIGGRLNYNLCIHENILRRNRNSSYDKRIDCREAEKSVD